MSFLKLSSIFFFVGCIEMKYCIVYNLHFDERLGTWFPSAFIVELDGYSVGFAYADLETGGCIGGK